MAHSVEEQQYLLNRDRIRDGELPFLKSAFEDEGWLRILNGRETYLLMACYYRQSSVIEFLLDKAEENVEKDSVKCWLKVVAVNDSSPLHNYLCASSLAYRRRPRHQGLPILSSILQRLVQIGYDVDKLNSYGESPLFLACASNDLIAVESLVRLGADVNMKCCALLETVLHQACLMKHNQMLELLLSAKGADIDAVNMHGWSPLHLAAQKADLGKVLCLLEHHADVTVRSNRGDTPLFFSLHKIPGETGSVSAFPTLFEHISTTFELEAANEQLLQVNNKGENLLECAVRHRNCEALTILLESGLFDVKQRDQQGRSLLHLSVIYAPDSDTLNYLLDSGLSPNEIDSDGNTPLMYFFKQLKVTPHMAVAGPSTPNVNV